MSKTLPERPDLGQLKKQAKDLLNDIRAGTADALARVPENDRATFALADAQRVLAREYGFPSWAKLKLHVETREIGLATARLVAAAANGNAPAMQTILKERPELARQTVSATAVLGDVEGLRQWVARNPEYAKAKGGACETEALGYVCLGRLGGDEAARVACADLLLAHGANPNATWKEGNGDDFVLPILYAATGRNNYAALARRLLAAGANPNDGESIYHAAEHHHVECLEALLAAGGDLSKRDNKWTNTPLYFLLGWSPGAGQAAKARQGILWLLDHGADPNVTAYQVEEVPLFVAIRQGWDLDLIRSFLDHGAHAGARRVDGRSLYAAAVRTGRDDVAALLVEHGGETEASAEDRFLGAIAKGEPAVARPLLAANHGWRETCADDIARLITDSVKRGDARPLEATAALGLEINRTNKDGDTALHFAAMHGQVPVVKRFIELGADINPRDRTYQAPPVGWCVHGSIHFKSAGSDYPAVAESLFKAGAEMVPIPRNEMDPALVAVFDRYGAKK